jgi:hypothetical protein
MWGYDIDTEKEIDFPPSMHVMVNVLDEKDAIADAGLDGITPSSYCWNKWLISSRRHIHSLLVVIREPPKDVNGSGSFELVGKGGLGGSVEHVPVLGCVDIVEIAADPPVIVRDVEVTGFVGVVTVTIEADCTVGG